MWDWISSNFRALVEAQMSDDGSGFWWVLGSYLLMLLIERGLYFLQDRHEWNERDARANLWNGILTAVVSTIVGGAIFVTIYQGLYENFRLFTVPLALGGWVAAFLLTDLAYYVDHRISHRVGFFWAIHHTHHSSNEMHLLVAQRTNVFMTGGLAQPTYFLLPIVGVPLPMLIVVQFFGNLWGIFNHTRLVGRMGPLDGVLATPSNHRVHHGSDAKYLDRNYGQTLILWDRLFGSFQREEETPTFGLVSPLHSYKIWDIQTSGFQWLVGQMRSANRWPDKLRYLVKPPGWSHDGRHETSATIQARALTDAVGGTHPRAPPTVR